MEHAYLVDVIIPTYRPDRKFHTLMRMLRKPTYPIRTIRILNTGTVLDEEDHYRRHLKQEAAGGHVPRMEVVHLSREEFDHGGTRNLGASFSDAEICVFMTQDAVPDTDHFIEELIRPFQQEGLMEQDYDEGSKRDSQVSRFYGEKVSQKSLSLNDPPIAVVYGRQLPAPDCDILECYTREFNYPPRDSKKSAADLPKLGIKTFFCSNVCAAYRMDVFRKLGGFETHTIFNEDMIYAGHAIRCGYSVYYASAACVVHSHNYTALTQFHRNFDLAVSQAQHPEVFDGIPSEKEGVRLVGHTAKYLLEQKKAIQIPRLFWVSGWKYLGYFLGRHYQKLPMWLIKVCTWQKAYWEGK